MLQLEAQGFARAAGPLPGDALLPQAAVLTLNEVVESPPPGCTAPVSFAFRRARLGATHTRSLALCLTRV